MDEDQKITEREPRIHRTFTVRINEDMSAEKPRWDIVMTQNISASGILFNYDHYLEPGSLIRFKIALPFCGSVDCVGEVVRNVMGTSRGFGNSSPAVCGIAAVFRDIAEQDRQAMREFFGNCHNEAAQTDEVDSSSKDEVDKKPRAKRIDRQFMIRIQRKAGSQWELVPVQNISSSGIFFTYSEATDADSELSLQITLPFLESVVVCHGTVVRMEDKTRAGALTSVYGIGVAFSDLDETVRRQFDEYAEQFGRE